MAAKHNRRQRNFALSVLIDAWKWRTVLVDQLQKWAVFIDKWNHFILVI